MGHDCLQRVYKPFETRDWQTNLSAQVTEMRTPKLLVGSLEESLKERVLVHRGFYEYLFDNKGAKFNQRYDMILDDIKLFLNRGTRSTLGAALSSLLAFELAGSDLA